MILSSPTGVDQEDQERQAFISEQLDTLQSQITETQTEIADLKFQLGELDSAREISDSQGQIASLQNKLSSLQSNYANLLSNTEKGAINSLTIIEQPHLPTRPVGSQQIISVGLAGAVGFTLAAAAAYLLEYLDKTIKTEDELKKLVSLPIIGYIPKFKKNENPWFYVNEQPRSPIADSFRSMRTNIGLMDGEKKTILVTGSAVSEGKSTVAVNLAHISAQSNKKVALIDADLRRSVLSEALNCPPEKGLSNILQNQSTIDVEKILLERDLLLLAAGPPTPNPTELLGSDKFEQTLADIAKMTDLVLIDSPPFIVTDASVLSTKVDGILIVVRLGHTRRDTLQAMLDQIKRTGTPIIGIVLNNISNRSKYYSHYYGSYYNPDNDKKKDQDENFAEEVISEEDVNHEESGLEIEEEPDTLMPIS